MKTKSANTEHCIDVCNKLLRGELSAVETYNQTIEKFVDDPAVSVLREIRQDHERAASVLRTHVQEMGGKPSTDSGAWGTLTAAAQGTAKAFGKSSALKGLKEGEEHGLNEYQEAINDSEVMPEHKAAMQTDLLPNTRRHVSQLDSLMLAQ